MQGRVTGQAEPLYRRSLGLREMTTVESMNNRALALGGKGDNGTAERLYHRALVMAGRIPVLSCPANVGASAPPELESTGPGGCAILQ